MKKGCHHSQQTKERMSIAHKGKPKSPAHVASIKLAKAKNRIKLLPIWIANLKNGNKGRTFTPEHKQRISAYRKQAKGPDSPNWKGGVSSVNQLIRGSLQMKLWREAVYKKDDYRCFDCGERGGQLNADHIYPFAHYPRLRFDMNNGRTLCKPCHQKTPTYAGRSNKITN